MVWVPLCRVVLPCSFLTPPALVLLMSMGTASFILSVGICPFFFFSSRRRHTRCSRDWSSDVCSSDLYLLYDSRWLNDAVGRACSTVQGLSMRTYRVIHRLHHNHLYGELDPDTALHGGYPRGRAYLVKKLLKDLAGLTAWKTYAYFLGGAPALNTATNKAVRPLDDTSSKLRDEARSDRNAVIFFHLTALLLFGLTGYLVQYLVLWILPLVTVVQAILRLRAIAEHGATTDFS